MKIITECLYSLFIPLFVLSRQNDAPLCTLCAFVQWIDKRIGGVTVSGRSWVRAPVGSSQRLQDWYLLLLH